MCDWREPVKEGVQVCKQHEWSWTVHVTQHLDSGGVSWAVVQLDGPADVWPVMTGESQSSDGALAAVFLALVDSQSESTVAEQPCSSSSSSSSLDLEEAGELVE